MAPDISESTSDSPIEEGWKIAGIQHVIFTRIFANLRHELVSPLSIARMTISILKGRLDKAGIDQDILRTQIDKLDQQIQESVVGIRALQLWDLPDNSKALPMEIIRQGLKLSSSRLSMRNITVELIPSTNQDCEEVEYQPFLYFWLGLLCYFEDHQQCPTTLKLICKTPQAFVLEIHVAEDGGLMGAQSARPSQVNKQALMRLASPLSISLHFEQNQVSFEWQ